MTEEQPPRLSRAFKLAALHRMQAGENVSALARELGIKRKLLYQWRDRLRAEGPAGLRSRGRPKRAVAEPVEMPAEVTWPARAVAAAPAVPPPSRKAPSPSATDSAAALAAAQARIAELERKVGRQELELDFFHRALRRVKDARSTNGAAVAPSSTRSSER